MRYDFSLSPGALRLALAVTVMLTHYLPMAGMRMYLPLDGVPVYGFFFLSGYWIAQLWDNKYQNTINPLLTFYLSRGWRIYPIATASTLLMFALSNRDWPGLLANLILIGKNGSPQAPALLDPPAWSLAIELQFYAIAPFLVVLQRNNVVTIAVLAMGFACWLIYAGGVSEIYLYHFIFLFALGVAFARRSRHKLARALAPYSLAAVTLCVIGAANAGIGAFVADHGLLRFAAIAIGLLGLPYVAASLGKPSHSADRTLGDLAYPVYLLHWPAMVIANRWPFGGMPPLAVALILTLGLSVVAHVAFDRPLERMRRRLIAGRMALLPTALASASAP